MIGAAKGRRKDADIFLEFSLHLHKTTLNVVFLVVLQLVAVVTRT